MRVAIVGAGPAGATLAALLARMQVDVALFGDGRRPELAVGESLVPALVPMLRRLGVEDKVARVGVRKPGVSFLWSADDRLHFSFERVAHCLPAYAYNVPRHEYDRILIESAERAGARTIFAAARLETMHPPDNAAEAAAGSDPAPRGGHEVDLDRDAVAAGWSDGKPPDLVVDATGRSRTTTRRLRIPCRRGTRDDMAYFAHFAETLPDDRAGQVLINRISGGWSWRIPLRDRLSVGVVLDRRSASDHGRSPEERLHAALSANPELADIERAGRLSSVATYSNYQLVTTRGHGPGWVAIGDAFGFVDPMLSPGVFLAQRSAEMLAESLRNATRDRSAAPNPSVRGILLACANYERRFAAMLSAWTELIESFYDGTMIALYRSGRELVAKRPGRLTAWMQNHIERQVAAMASGASTTSPYSRSLLRCLRRFGLRGFDPRDFAVDGHPEGRPAR